MSSNREPRALTRRDALTTLAVGSAALVVGCKGRRGSTTTTTTIPAAKTGPIMAIPKSLAGAHEVVPLPFKPAALNGISEKMIVSHHDNNYAGAVKNLNKVELQIAQATSDTPAFVLGGLHQSELTYRNSKTLHEAYFGNLGGTGKRSGAIEKALADAYGASSRWEESFRALGNSLGGGSGWTVLEFELMTGTLRNTWSSNHTQTLSTSVPLLVLDMYEHAYQMDYGAAAAKYVDAFFTNVNWDIVNHRLDRALAAMNALRG